MRDVLLGLLKALSAKLGCGEDLSTDSGLPPAPVERTSGADKACGVEGFGPFREGAPEAAVSETVSADGYRTWACLFSFSPDSPEEFDSVYFVISSNSQLVADAKERKEGSSPERIEIRSCDAGQTMLYMDYPHVLSAPERRLLKEALGGSDELFDAFVAAAAEELGC